jgi:hypothetical protein
MSGLTTIKLSSEDLKKEQERQRKRGRLIFNTFKKGKVKVVIGRYDEDGTVPDIIFQYQIHNAHVKSFVDYTNGNVECLIRCFYEDVDIFNEDGSEITEKLSYLLVRQIEDEIENILSGRDRSQRAAMLRKASNALTLFKGMSKEQVKEMFIAEYKKKYGDLQTGKKTLEQIKSESIAEAKAAGKVL